MPKKISNFDAATREVKETIGRTVYKELERYLCARALHWWGENKGQDISKLMLLATCLHDARAYSYAAISDILKPKLVIHANAIQHNVKKARRVFAQWGEENITMPNKAALNAAVADRNFPIWMSRVRWWMDSTDIPLPRRKAYRGRKSIYWSGKLNRPAWRYQILRDGCGKICKLWGGYSPKVYDSDFVKIEKQWLERHLRGTAILADTHYFKGREYISNPEILATPPDNASADLLKLRGFSTTTKEARVRSKAIKNNRGVVEQCFAAMKNTFIPLAGGPYTSWRESGLELDFVVEWACGVYNRQKQLAADD